MTSPENWKKSDHAGQQNQQTQGPQKRCRAVMSFRLP